MSTAVRSRLPDLSSEMVALQHSTCPGCALRMPISDDVVSDGYFHTSPECWQVYTEVLGSEFSNALLFGQVHQLTVDTYAVQHAGDMHPDKSVRAHLAGLHLVLEKRLTPPSVTRLLQRLAGSVQTWPHLLPPSRRGLLTVRDIARAGSPEDHIELVREWSRSVWEAWSCHHAEVADLVQRHLSIT